MDECFRFLINVDECINATNFGIFFYRLESQGRFHAQSVKLGCPDDSALENAARNIRSYLNKNSYYVDNYQIIVAMRRPFIKSVDKWQDTLLLRMLKLHRELQCVDLLIGARQRGDSALNLIMMYDARFNLELPKLGRYVNSNRFTSDIVCMLAHFNITKDSPLDRPSLREALSEYARTHGADSVAFELLSSFLSVENDLPLPELDAFLDTEDFDSSVSFESLIAELASFLAEVLANQNVFEMFVDRNDPRDSTLQQLKIVDYINSDFSTVFPSSEEAQIISLSERCDRNWDAVVSDAGIEKKYAVMLNTYRRQLKDADNALSSPLSASLAKKMPEFDPPGSEAISCDESIPSDEGSDYERSEHSPVRILKSFSELKLTPFNIKDSWNSAYASVKNELVHLDSSLETYALDLSSQYSKILDNRKKDTFDWKSGLYYVTDEDRKTEICLRSELEMCAAELKSPQMTPALKFQDQLNVENSLEQVNRSIELDIRCLREATSRNFALIFLFVIAVLFVHYSVLQPYVFTSFISAVSYIVYLCAACLLLLSARSAPLFSQRRSIRERVGRLIGDMEAYLQSYRQRADNFKRYVNLMNRLDYLTRYSALFNRADKNSLEISQCILWHSAQIKKHLEKLKYFQGLISSTDVSDGSTNVSCDVYSIEYHRKDVIDCPIYWPQGK